MLAEVLKKLRSERELSQAELASALDMNGKVSTIGMWESGGSVPTLPSLIKLADFYGVSIDYLVGRDVEFNPVPISADELGLNAMHRMEYRKIIREITELINERYNKEEILSLFRHLTLSLHLVLGTDWCEKVEEKSYESMVYNVINDFRKEIYDFESQVIDMIVKDDHLKRNR